MSVWSNIGNRLNNVRKNIKAPKLGERLPRLPLPRPNDKGGEKAGRKKYEYHEPEASVLLNQRAVWNRLKGGEKPEDALGASASVLKVHHVPCISVIVTTYEPFGILNRP